MTKVNVWLHAPEALTSEAEPPVLTGYESIGSSETSDVLTNPEDTKR